MNRVMIIATTEFLTLVRTKGFIVGLLLMPVLIGASIGFQSFAASRADVDDHRFAVVDRTGHLFEGISAAAREHNDKAADGRQGPKFVPEAVPADGVNVLALSDRVRRKELFAFIDIPASVLDASRTDEEEVSYYTETPSYTPLPQWLRATLAREITAERLRLSTPDPALVERLTRSTTLNTLGLFERLENGDVTTPKRTGSVATFLMAFGMMYLLFIALMTSAPQLLTAIIEEKMSRISEVLVASVTPTQLMAGKLLGVSTVAVLLSLLYLAGGAYAAVTTGQLELLRPALVGWFLIYLCCTVLMFGSIFLAIGAICSDLKDSQAIMQTVMILVVLPLFMSPVVLRAPNSLFSVVVSLFPTNTPFLMLMRLSMTPAPPMWQVALSIVLSFATTVVIVWAAGKIFRIGLLMQGKPPNLPEVLRWIRQ